MKFELNIGYSRAVLQISDYTLSPHLLLDAAEKHRLDAAFDESGDLIVPVSIHDDDLPLWELIKEISQYSSGFTPASEVANV